MKLQNDQTPPSLTATSVEGATVRIPEDLEREWAAILFYRGHW